MIRSIFAKSSFTFMTLIRVFDKDLQSWMEYNLHPGEFMPICFVLHGR